MGCLSGDTSVEETEQEKALAEIAVKTWQRHKEVLVPWENKYIRDVTNINPEERQNLMGGVATAVGREADRATDEVTKADIASGAAPGSGRFNTRVAEVGIGRGEAIADATRKATTGLEEQRIQGLKDVIAMGRGVAGEGVTATSNVARGAVDSAIDTAYSRADARGSTSQALGTAAGMGVAGYLNYRKLARDEQK